MANFRDPVFSKILTYSLESLKLNLSPELYLVHSSNFARRAVISEQQFLFFIRSLRTLHIEVTSKSEKYYKKNPTNI